MRASLRTIVVAATSATALGLSAPLGLAAEGAPPSGSHIPAPMQDQAGIQACDTIPSEHDPEITQIVYDEATGRDVTDRVLLSAFEAGWVESHMNNLDCGHSDSLGVFQQRPSQGWGTPEEIMDPVYATNAYLDQAIPNAANNPGWTAGEVAQSVQRSAYPERYDQAEDKARELIAEITG